MRRALVFSALLLALLLPRVSSAALIYVADLTGLIESPPNASPATGFAQVDLDLLAHTMRVQATFSDLVAPTTAAHIHAATAVPGTGTAGVATQTPSFTGFPLGVISGTYDHLFDLTLTSSFNAPFVTANGGTAATAEAALAASLAAGTAYFNIHTQAFPGGEIRGFFAAQTVPEPATLGLLALGGLGALVARRKRARS